MATITRYINTASTAGGDGTTNRTTAQETIDNASAVDKGSGQVGIPITGHSITTSMQVSLGGTTNYTAGGYTVSSTTANEVVITATYVAEAFAGTETMDDDNRAYASLSEWESNEQTNLVSDGDTHVVYVEGSTADTTATTISGWTTGSGNEISVETNGTSLQHDGSWDTGLYRLTAGSNILTIGQAYTTIFGLQFEHTSGNFHDCLVISGVDNVTLSHNFVRNTGGLRTNGIRIAVAGGANNIVYNNIVVDMDDGASQSASGQTGIYMSSVNVEGKIYNNTVYNCHDGIETFKDSANVIVENNHVTATVDGVAYAWPATTTNIVANYNLSDDATADDPAGTGDQINVTGTEFTDPGTEYKLVTGATAKDNGKDLSGTFLDDFTRTTRSGTWDIGAHEFIGAGGDGTDISWPIMERMQPESILVSAY